MHENKSGKRHNLAVPNSLFKKRKHFFFKFPSTKIKKALHCALIILLLSACVSEKKQIPGSENFDLVKLADGIYSCIHKRGGKAICNVGIVDNGEETVIFDSFLSPTVAQELSDLLPALGLSPVKYVLNSHYHNDHIRGNQVFPEEVQIISTKRTKELIEEMEPLEIENEKSGAPARFAYYDSLYQNFSGEKESREYQQILMWRPYYQVLANSYLEVETRLPSRFVDSIMHLDGPKRRVQVITKGQGHTESDLILYLPDDKTVFTGDLVFNKCHPYVAHGNISKWKAWLEFMVSLDVKKVMPGHGQMGDGGILITMKTYLEDLEKSARQLVDENKSIDEANSMGIPTEYQDWWFDRFYAYNLSFAYNSLKKEE